MRFAIYVRAAKDHRANLAKTELVLCKQPTTKPIQQGYAHSELAHVYTLLIRFSIAALNVEDKDYK